MPGWELSRCYRWTVQRAVELALDAEQMIRHRMATRGVTFEQAVNDSIRQGFDRGGRWEPSRTLTAPTAEPAAKPDRCAPQAAAELDDEALRIPS